MKVVVVASRFPYPLEKGDKLRLYHQIKALSQTHQITLIALSESPVKPAHLAHLQQFCPQIYILPLPKWQVGFNLVKGFLRGMPLQVSYFYSPHLKKQIHRLIEQLQPLHIYCQLVRMAPYVAEVQMRKTLDYQDAFSIGMQRRAERSSFWLKWLFRLEAKRLQAYEQLAFERFDHCIIISKQDRDLLTIPQKEKIAVVPNGVDVQFFQPNPSIPKVYDLVFVGNMGYHPNVTAAKYLVKNVMPILQKQMPDVKLLIAGARPTPEVVNLAGNNVEVSGWIDDVRQAYLSAKLFMAPIFLGSGQQNKILEAMACGLPCITTPQVNNAIGATVNQTILLAEQAKTFADIAGQLLNDEALRTQIGDNARKFVQQRFSWQSATTGLDQSFLDLGY